jgi:hypothetical protein
LNGQIFAFWMKDLAEGPMFLLAPMIGAPTTHDHSWRKDMTYKMTALFLLTSVMGSAALAMTDADSNGDGRLSVEEFLAAYPELTATTFEATDVNEDGLIDGGEFAAGVTAGVLPAQEG